MGRMDGKVAFITGAARGQGRAHAVRLAQEGADIVVTDLAGPVETVTYTPATSDDLAETAKEVEALGRRVISFEADVRDHDALRAGLDAAVAELGGLDVVVANAGIINAVRPSWELDEADWQTMIDINLSGVWHTTKAAIPHLIERGPGGSLVLISSTAGLRGIPGIAHYNAAKHGVLGLSRTLANELAPHRIRVNSVHPTNVDTPLIQNESAYKLFRPDLEDPSREDVAPVFESLNLLPIPWIQPEDVAEAVLYLAADSGRYVTGGTHRVDAGWNTK